MTQTSESSEPEQAMRLALPRHMLVLLCSLGASIVALVMVSTASSAGSNIKDGHGRLTVETSPTVASQVTVDGIRRNISLVRGLELPAGSHTVCFDLVEGYLPPPCERIDLADGQALTHVGVFQPAGLLTVRTQGANGNIVIDGIDRDRGSVTLPVSAGTHEVCFADVSGFSTPSCQSAAVAQGATTSIVGLYVEPLTSPDPVEDVPSEEPIPQPAPPATGTPPAPKPPAEASRPTRPQQDRETGQNRSTPGGFSDVGDGVHRQAIQRMAEQGVLGGYPDGTFRPAAHVTRGQVATMVVAAFDLDPAACTDDCRELNDVGSSVHGQAIRSAVDAGVVSGYPDGTFRPNDHVSRGQLAAILAQVLGLSDAGSAHPFADVQGTTHEGRIAALYDAGIARGTTSTTYSPSDPVRRDQFATLLSQSLDLD